ncbi:MAG: winged helix-turn-helix transcriptional regulator, partial [Actinomycetia bacterium]|nr:winged helix-turn-helix transcriptional regulator [Actinomycetes bacterium]
MKSQTADRPSGQDGDVGTRERVLASIMEQGSATATALAQQLQLTAAAVRRHLAALEEQGL